MELIGIAGKFYKPEVFKKSESNSKKPCEVCDLNDSYDACNSVQCFSLRDNKGIKLVYKKQF